MPQRCLSLMVVLIFSAPLITLAQQHSTSQGINAVNLAAKAAEKNASRDVNRLLWFGRMFGMNR